MRRSLFRASTTFIGFLTDVEGDMGYFNRYVSSSRVLDRDESSGLLQLRDNCRFVFGGDAFDKGSGDLTFAQEMVSLKDRYPERVTLLLGNRDINKMRLTSELDEAQIASEVPKDVPIPFWLSDVTTAVSYADYLAKNNLTHTAVAKLRWMLACNMGSDTAWELRRTEVAGTSSRDVSQVSDEDVLNSFLASLAPGGAVFEYLDRSDIGAVIGDSLFVHGGIGGGAAGFVPDSEKFAEGINKLPLPGTEMLEDNGGVQAWVKALNDYARRGIASWRSQPKFIESANGGRTRGGTALLAYAHQKSVLGRSVMVHSYLSGRGKGAYNYIDVRAVQHLNQSGIVRVLSGHQPGGDIPKVISQPGLTAITADTSYCGPNKSRGDAVAEVLVAYDDETNSSATLLHGCRADGSPYEFVVEDEAPRIGRLLNAEGEWSKARLPSGEFLLERTEGFKRVTRTVSAAELDEMLMNSPVDNVADGDTFGCEGIDLTPKKPKSPVKTKVDAKL